MAHSYRFFYSCLLLFPVFLFSQSPNQVPAIHNLAVSANWVSNQLILTYDVSDAESDPLDIALEFSSDGGKTFTLTSLVPASGDLGFPVTPGNGKTITCDLSALANQFGAFTVRLVADDKQDFDIQALVNEVDSSRLKADLQFIEGIRHRNTGLAHLNETRDSLHNLYLDAGLFTEDQTFLYGGATGHNILGHQPGTAAAQQVVIVDAHYDTVSNAPGADDNGSGTVGVMEITRLLSRYPAKKTLRYISFDMEEDGLKGSAAYVAALPATDTIAGVLNFEMIGYYSETPFTQTIPNGFGTFFPVAVSQIQADSARGNFITNVGNDNCTGLALRFDSAAAHYVPDLKVVKLISPGIGAILLDLARSDHASFWAAQKPALMLTDGADFRNHNYHKPTDQVDKLNFTFMSNVVKATLATAAELAEVQHGDWETTSFEHPVGTGEPLEAKCSFSLLQNPQSPDHLFFDWGNCPLSEVALEIFDSKGSRLHGARLLSDAPSVTLPVLPSGLYFATLSWPGGQKAQRFFIP